jgi:preprotein translocase subunit YajC
MFISNAYAQTATAANAAASPLAGLFQSPILPIALVFVVFYFLLIRPQQNQAKELKNKLNALARNDKIITAGGIIGTVKKVTEGDANIDVEIAPNVTVSIVRSTITQVVGSAAKAEKVVK